jgi:hypothetical protein
MAQLGLERQITRITKSTKTICVRFALLVIVVLYVFLVLSAPANAWGSITHSAICRDAGGSEEYVMGGIAPDMIALRSVTTGDSSYDYAHNCYGGSREPVFGNILAGISSSGFASGWRAHQLADSIVHGEGGYSTSKTVFRSLPGRYGIDINHGAVELIVDAIILQDYYRGNVSLYIPEQAELIHDGAVAFYNRAVGKDGAVPRGNIILCRAAQDMAFNWRNCLQTNIFLAAMLAEEPWFSQTRDEFSDYRAQYDRSVNLLNGIIARQDDNAGVLSALVDAVVPPRVARAAGPETAPETTNTYYSFLNEVSTRAREIGGGKATKESTRQAINELSGDASVPAEQRAWAEALDEMTNGRNRSRTELEKKVSGRLARGRDGSAKGAERGQRTSFLPYLPCSCLIFLIGAILVYLLRRKKEVM